jgi:hypothetical protein
VRGGIRKQPLILLSFILLDYGDLFNAARVAAAYESGVQKSLHHFNGLTAANDTPAEGQHTGVVVLAGQASSADIVRHWRRF